jgi:hypothetical protein
MMVISPSAINARNKFSLPNKILGLRAKHTLQKARSPRMWALHFLHSMRLIKVKVHFQVSAQWMAVNRQSVKSTAIRMPNICLNIIKGIGGCGYRRSEAPAIQWLG